MKKILLLLAISVAALAQDGLPTASSQGPPNVAYQKFNAYTNSLLNYSCIAPSVITTGQRAGTPFAISAATAASPGVFTTTGHGINLNSRPILVVTGGTGNWAAANGTWVAKPLDANTFNLYTTAGVALNTTGFGAVTGSLQWTTTAPLLNQPDWAVTEYFYDVSNNLLTQVWLNGSTGFGAKCTDATSTTNNLQ